jgi:hypothetical protein
MVNLVGFGQDFVGDALLHPHTAVLDKVIERFEVLDVHRAADDVDRSD